MKRTIQTLCSVGLLLLASVPSACAEEESTPPSSVELTRLAARLKEENDALRKENQRLRKELVARKSAGRGESTPKIETDDSESVQAAGPDTGYWLSKSGKRHNRKCRAYRKGKGRPCSPTAGEPCKNCGG